MKYLIVGRNPTTNVIEWNIIDNRYSVARFIKLNYCGLIQKCNFSWKELSKYILIFEIEPNYETLFLDITKPVEFTVELKG